MRQILALDGLERTINQCRGLPSRLYTRGPLSWMGMTNMRTRRWTRTLMRRRRRRRCHVKTHIPAHIQAMRITVHGAPAAR